MAGKSISISSTLSRRELNRAVLARQMLLRREKVGAVDAVERLAGMQAQYSPSPYVGLWTRLEGFRHEDLTSALLSRSVVKATLMRVTLHIVTARDFIVFDKALGDSRVATWSRYAEKLGLNGPELHRYILDFLSEPRTREQMIEHLGSVPMNTRSEPDPDRRRQLAWRVATAPGGILHASPSGTWKYFGKTGYVTATDWLSEHEEPSLEAAHVYMVKRYLAAFGPASRADILAWSGLRRVGDVESALRLLGDEVLAFRGPDGGNTLLFDLSASPRPPESTPAPVRFLPKWDNILLAYNSKDRERVLPREYHKAVIRVNGDVLPTILVDGMVAGVWSVSRKGDTALLEIRPFQKISPPDLEALESEGDNLVRFYEPDAASYRVTFLAD